MSKSSAVADAVHDFTFADRICSKHNVRRLELIRIFMTAVDQRLALEQLQKGLAQHRAGQLGLALSHYQRAAKLDPKNANAWHLLGVAALQNEALPLAVKHFRTTIKLSPGFAEAHNNLGVALRRMGRHNDSAGAFMGALKARDRYVEAIYNLGLACESIGNVPHALSAYRQALQWRPDDFNASNNLGNLLRRNGNPSEALPLLEQARRLQPESAQANGNLAMLMSDLGRHGDAVRFAQIAASIEPASAQWWGVLGVAERLQRNTVPAIAALRRAIELAPNDDVALSELGLALAEAGAIEESREVFLRARPSERHAERMRWTRALSLPSVYLDEAQVDAERARFAQGLEDIEAGLKLETPPQRLHAYEAVCGVASFLLHYQDRNNTDLQNRFGNLVTRVLQAAVPLYMKPCAWRAGAHEGPLRIGIVSSHLMHHTVSRYFRNLLLRLDAARFQLHVWYSGETADFSTELFVNRAITFEQVNEDALVTAAKIYAAQIDVLIYPEIGMDPRHNVLGALRLSPVQCALYGHPATSGLANMDYYIGGDALEPANAQTHYRERLVRLPGIGAIPEAPMQPASGEWLDKYTDGMPLLLCLQNHLKLVPAFDAILAQIALRSHAKIAFFVRNELVGQRFRQRIETAFAQAGLDIQRSLAFLPAQEYVDYLGAISRATLVLDSPWFSGGATSLDAFKIGAPVLALEGSMARGRQTSGMLRMMQIDALTATDADDYIAKAMALIADPCARDALRAQILERNHVLFDGAGVIEAFEDFLRRAVQAAGQAPAAPATDIGTA